MSAALATTAMAAGETQGQIRREAAASASASPHTAAPEDVKFLRKIQTDLLNHPDSDTLEAKQERALVYSGLSQKYLDRMEAVQQQLEQDSSHGLDTNNLIAVQHDTADIASGLNKLTRALTWDIKHPGDDHELTALQDIHNTFDEINSHAAQYAPGLAAGAPAAAAAPAAGTHYPTLADRSSDASQNGGGLVGLASRTVKTHRQPVQPYQERVLGQKPTDQIVTNLMGGNSEQPVRMPREQAQALVSDSTNNFELAKAATQPGVASVYSLSNYTYYAMVDAEDKKHPGNPHKNIPMTQVITCVEGAAMGPLDRRDPRSPVVGADMPLIVQTTQTPTNPALFDNTESTRMTAYFDLKSGTVNLHLYTNHNEEITAQAQMVNGPNGPVIKVTNINDAQNEYHLNIERDGIQSQRDQNLFTRFDNMAQEALLVAINSNKNNAALHPGGGYPDDFRSAVVDPKNGSVQLQMGNWRFIVNDRHTLTGVNTQTGDTIQANSQDFYQGWVSLGLDGRRPTIPVANMGNVTVTHNGVVSNYNFTPGSPQQVNVSSPGRSETYDTTRRFPDEIYPQLLAAQKAIDYAAPKADQHWFNQWFPQIPGGSKAPAGLPGDASVVPDFAKPPQKPGQKPAAGASSDSGTIAVPAYYKDRAPITETPLPPPPSRAPAPGAMAPQ